MNKKYYYIIYKITCLCGSLKEHYYIGRHKTTNLNDGYTGSGRIICDYFDKYDRIENVTYKKEILAYAKNDTELNKLEHEFIGDKYDSDPLCLNLRAGGDHTSLSKESKELLKISQKITWSNPELRQRQSESHKGKPSKLKGTSLTDEHRKHLSENHADVSGENNPMFGKNWKDYMTEEDIKARAKKISEHNKGKNTGENNGMYGKKLKDTMSEEVWESKNKKIGDQIRGRHYMTNGEVIKNVKPEDIDYYLSIGYVMGRKIKDAA